MNKNNINGIVLLNKPSGITSNKVLQQVKKIFKANKAGHMGSLDPLASGVLPICLGNSTKFSSFGLESDKEYLVKAKLGQRTDTLDCDGNIIEENNLVDLSKIEFEAIIYKYLGDILQVPPMYSALKKNGQPLYKLARQGIEIEREARKVTIFNIEILDFNKQEFFLRVLCSKGTYIRSLVDDIGMDIGCGAHVIELCRIKAGDFKIKDSFTIEQIEKQKENLLLPVDAALNSVDSIILDQEQSIRFCHGQRMSLEKNNFNNNFVEEINDLVEDKIVKVIDFKKKFLGIAKIIVKKGILQPNRLV